ncbi:MAG: ATP-binding protein [Thermodesulfobacteriota bacterium]
MKLCLSIRSIRVRVALWFSATLALVLLVYAGLTWVFLRHTLMNELDERLTLDLGSIQEILTHPGLGDGECAEAVRDLAGREDDLWVEVRLSGGGLLCEYSPPGQDSFKRYDAMYGPREEGYRSLEWPHAMSLRVLRARRSLHDGRTAYFQVGRSERQVRHEQQTFFLAHGIGLPLAIIIAGFGGYSVARRVLTPVERMARQAKTISAERLGDRLPVDNPDDELGHLATAFNATFSRLEGSFDQLNRFTADASHELRTPLTAIRSVGEVGLQGSHSRRELRDIIGSMLEEADRMTGMVDGLLSFSRAESGAAGLDRGPVDISALAGEVADCLGVLAEEKEQTLKAEAPAPVVAVADRLVLRQALMNILDNAIKYTPAGGNISVRVARQDAWAEVVIEDTGPGISPEHHDRIFERFSRIDRGRARMHGGCGLGLSIAKRAVEIHGGAIELASAPGQGSRFRILIPRQPPSLS